MKARKDVWKRTGKTREEFSHNKKGIITLAQEVNDKGWTRDVQIAYRTVELEQEGDK